MNEPKNYCRDCKNEISSMRVRCRECWKKKNDSDRKELEERKEHARRFKPY